MPIDSTGFGRMLANKAVEPRVAGKGFGLKLTGRVAPTQAVKSASPKELEMSENTNMPIEFQSSSHTKEAAMFSPGTQRIIGDVGMAALTGLGTMALTSVGGAAMDLAKEKLIDNPAFERSFQRCLQLEPQLRSYPQEELHQYFMLVAEASPSVAKNPLLAAQYLRYLVDYKGTANFNAFSDLAKLQGQLNDNKAGNNPYTDALHRGLASNAAKRIIDPDYKRGGRN